MIRATLFAFLSFAAFGADVSGRWNVRLMRFGEDSPGTSGTKV